VKGPVGRPVRRSEVNIRMGLKEGEFEGVDWIHLVQGKAQWWAVVNTVMNFEYHKRSGIC